MLPAVWFSTNMNIGSLNGNFFVVLMLFKLLYLMYLLGFGKIYLQIEKKNSDISLYFDYLPFTIDHKENMVIFSELAFLPLSFCFNVYG